MKKVAATLTLSTMLVAGVAPAQASWSDVQVVRSMIKSAYYKQNSFTQDAICSKWRVNPSHRLFIRLARTADRMYGISTREAAKGTVLAFNDLC